MIRRGIPQFFLLSLGLRHGITWKSQLVRRSVRSVKLPPQFSFTLLLAACEGPFCLYSHFGVSQLFLFECYVDIGGQYARPVPSAS